MTNNINSRVTNMVDFAKSGIAKFIWWIFVVMVSENYFHLLSSGRSWSIFYEVKLSFLDVIVVKMGELAMEHSYWGEI